MKLKRLFYFLFILLLLGIFSYIYPSLTGNQVLEYYEKEQIILIRAIDGDTIKDQFNQSYRLLGINTPEKTMPYFGEAALFLKQFEGKKITLVRDKTDIDKYGRKLRYLFYDGKLLNEEILARGLANSYYTKGLIYEKEFLLAEKKAKNNGLGIWAKSEEICAKENCIVLNELNPKQEFFSIKNSCSFYCNLEGWFVKDLGRNTFFLSGLVSNGEEKYFSKKEVWNNEGDRFTLYDQKGLFVFDYDY